MTTHQVYCTWISDDGHDAAVAVYEVRSEALSALDAYNKLRDAVKGWLRNTPEGRAASVDEGGCFNWGSLPNYLNDSVLGDCLEKQGITQVEHLHSGCGFNISHDEVLG